MPTTGIGETLDQFDNSFGSSSTKKTDFAENQRILDWAKASASRDPNYVKHICDRYHQRKNAEKLERANAIGRRK